MATGQQKTPASRTGSTQDGKPGSGAAKLVVLAVGELGHWRNSGTILPWDSDIVFKQFGEINQSVLAELQPDVVVSPLLCRSFDFLDLAHVLCDFNFRGRYRVMIRKLPDPEIVLEEARALCPDLDIGFIVDQVSQSKMAN